MSETATSMPARTTQAVFDHHLQAFSKGLDAIVSDYTEASTLVLQDRTIRGLAGIRTFFDAFLTGVQPGFWEAFRIVRQEVSGDVAYLAWDAKPFVGLATDTFVVRDGKILVQTYTVLG